MDGCMHMYMYIYIYIYIYMCVCVCVCVCACVCAVLGSDAVINLEDVCIYVYMHFIHVLHLYIP